MLAMASAEAQGDEPTQKHVATRRRNDPVPGAGSSTPKSQRVKKRSKAHR
jgi:hypothetical protein